MDLNREQLAILNHTAHRAAGGFYSAWTEKTEARLAADIRDIKQRQRDYLQAVEPITRERVRLSMMFTRPTIFPATGEVRREYPPEIQAIDDKYAELTKVLQLRFLGTANAQAHRRKKPQEGNA